MDGDVKTTLTEVQEHFGPGHKAARGMSRRNRHRTAMIPRRNLTQSHKERRERRNVRVEHVDHTTALRIVCNNNDQFCQNWSLSSAILQCGTGRVSGCGTGGVSGCEMGGLRGAK